MNTIDSGEMELEEKPTDLRAFAEELAEHFADERPEKHLRITADTAGLRDKVVYCDANRLRRVLGRLMINSCVFAPEGGTISLCISQGPEQDGEFRAYEFCIRNAGTEIPEDARERFFEETGWEQNQRRAELPGVGLGMTVAKAFVDAMGGTIRVSSDKDGDTQVLLNFSFRPAPQAAEAVEPEKAGEALHVLLVDDNELNREIGELMLTGEGWTVDLAGDGAEAVEKIKTMPGGTYDAILMDVNMPKMNGYEATGAIRALSDKEKASLPVIALTAGTSQESAGKALAAGMDGFASKPIDPAVILRELARIRAGK